MRKTPAKKSATGARSAPKTKTARSGKRSNLYAGAQNSRLTADWIFSACSTKQELQQNMRRMRLRARDLERNSPKINWYLTLLKANVIGKQYPRLQCQVRDANGNLDKKTNAYLEQRFAKWAKCVTTDGRLNLTRFLHQALQRLAMDGEIFDRRAFGYPHNEFGFALELLEPDLLDENFNTSPADRRGADIRLGVQVDEWRRPLAYHFWTDYPGEREASSERVPIAASEVLHLFEPQRSVQTRGVTWMKAILMSIKMLDGYFEGELVSSRAAAQKMFGLKYDDPSSYEAPDPDEGPIQIESSPGEGFTIPPGMSIQTFDPQHPNGAFESFVKGANREIAGGVGTTYNTFANDAQGVSWSTLRSFSILERDVWAMTQALICESLLPWIFEGWLQAGTLTGAIQLPTRDWRKYTEHSWRPRGWQWVDPQNEAAAAKLKLGSALASPQMILDPQGVDVEDVLEQRKAFRELCREYGEDPATIEAAWMSQGSLPSKPAGDNGGEATGDPKGDPETDDDEEADDDDEAA